MLVEGRYTRPFFFVMGTKAEVGRQSEKVISQPEIPGIFSAHAAARILTGKLHPEEPLNEEELRPAVLPQTSILLEEHAHKTWMQARQAADKARAEEVHEVGAQKKRYEEMTLPERVATWSEDVIGFLKETISSEASSTWGEGFTALGLQEAATIIPQLVSSNQEDPPVKELARFLQTDFYLTYCAVSPDLSAGAIATSMTNHFILQKAPKEKASGAIHRKDVWNTMLPLFERMFDEDTLQDVDLIQQAQTRRALGHIHPSTARESLLPEEVELFTSLCETVKPDVVIGELTKSIPDTPEAHLETDLKLNDTDADRKEDARVTEEQIEQPDISQPIPSDSRRSEPVVVKHTAIQSTQPPEVISDQPSRVRRRPSPQRLFPPVASPAVNPPRRIEVQYEKDDTEITKQPKEHEKFDRGVQVYMHLQADAYASVFRLQAIYSAYSQALQVGPKSLANKLHREYATLRANIFASALTQQESEDHQFLQNMVELVDQFVVKNPLYLANIILAARLRHSPHWQTVAADKQVIDTVVDNVSDLFVLLPQALDEITGVMLHEEKVTEADIRNILAALQKNAAYILRANSVQELAAQAKYLTDVPANELALYIADMVGIDLIWLAKSFSEK